MKHVVAEITLAQLRTYTRLYEKNGNLGGNHYDLCNKAGKAKVKACIKEAKAREWSEREILVTPLSCLSGQCEGSSQSGGGPLLTPTRNKGFSKTSK